MAGTEVSVMKELKGILATDNVKNRFNEVLGKKAPQFMTSIINVVILTGQGYPNRHIRKKCWMIIL